MNNKLIDPLEEISAIISELVGSSCPPYSLLGTPISFTLDVRMFGKKTEADEALALANDLITNAMALETNIKKLKKKQLARLFGVTVSTNRPEPSSIENRTVPVDSFQESLSEHLLALKNFAKEEVERINAEIARFWKSDVRQPNPYPSDVAYEIAKIYVREKCQIPKYGHNDGEPSTDYCRAVRDVFHLLGITISFRSPARKAKKRVEGEMDLESAKRELEFRSNYRSVVIKRAASP